MSKTPRIPARGRAGALAALSVWALAGACADAGPAGPRPARAVILVTLDTLRADHLGCYGYDRPTSPNLDALAEGATLFTRAVSSGAWTAPSHASLFTGLDPYEHGTVSILVDRPLLRNVFPLHPRHVTLAEALRANGFATAAFVANGGFLSTWLKLDQGFDTYRVKREPAAKKNRAISRWLAAHRQRPFFLFVNFMDTHRPYNTKPRPGFLDPPAPTYKELAISFFHRVMAGEGPIPEDVRKLVIDQYDTAIAHVDEAVGELVAELRRLGLYDDVLLVVTSDHGEFFGEHGLAEHSKDVYQPVLRVPLLVKYAGQTRGERRDEIVSSVHVAHLVATGLASPVRERLLERFPRAPGDDPVLAENYYARTADLLDPRWGHRFRRVRRAVFDGKWKLLHSSDSAHELYDLESDPGETRNLADSEPEVVKRLSAYLEERLARGSRFPRPVRPNAPPPELTAEEEAELRELGYAR